MTSVRHSAKILAVTTISVLLAMFILYQASAEPADEMEKKVKTWAMECQGEVKNALEMLVTSGKLTMTQLFDTFYIPIPGTSPQKFKTQYDALCDRAIQYILDKYLAKDPRLVYVVAVDRNGYVPTHNSMSEDRAKRIFNDRTGLTAARNTQPYLVQKYFRDTGQTLYDLSVPLYIQNRHWGAIRICYSP